CTALSAAESAGALAEEAAQDIFSTKTGRAAVVESSGPRTACTAKTGEGIAAAGKPFETLRRALLALGVDLAPVKLP
ncbi:hypothetical protein LZC20_09810, partial [Campylobacter coli]|nr:hypothetical protein [Campylobacter coli]